MSNNLSGQYVYCSSDEGRPAEMESNNFEPFGEPTISNQLSEIRIRANSNDSFPGIPNQHIVNGNKIISGKDQSGSQGGLEPPAERSNSQGLGSSQEFSLHLSQRFSQLLSITEAFSS